MSENVSDFQEELTELLTTGLDGETGLLVRFGFPKEVPKQNERVYVTTSSNYRLGGGEQFREESFAVGFVVECYRSGDDPATVSRRRWAIINLIDTALYEDDFHGYASQGLTLAAEDELVGYDTGWLARSVCTIGVSDEV